VSLWDGALALTAAIQSQRKRSTALEEWQEKYREICAGRAVATKDAELRYLGDDLRLMREGWVNLKMVGVATRLGIKINELLAIEAEGNKKGWPKK